MLIIRVYKYFGNFGDFDIKSSPSLYGNAMRRNIHNSKNSPAVAELPQALRNFAMLCFWDREKRKPLNKYQGIVQGSSASKIKLASSDRDYKDRVPLLFLNFQQQT